MSGTVSESRKAIKANDRRIATIDGKSGVNVTVPINSLKEERAKLLKENDTLNKNCLGASDKLKTLNTVRFYASKVVLEPEDVRKFMDEKVGKMSVKMALREEIAKVAREDITKERNHIKSRGKEESL